MSCFLLRLANQFQSLSNCKIYWKKLKTWDMLYDEIDPVVTNTRNDLLKYCELDTLAMVKILDKIEYV